MKQLPMGIRKRGAAFVADVTVDGRRRTASAASLEEAILLRSQLAGRTPEGRPVVQAWTIEKAIKTTHDIAWAGRAWEVNAMRNANAFAKHFGARCPLDHVNTEGLDRWASALAAEGKSNATINRHMAAASKLFSVAHERGGVAGKPKFPRRREGQGRVRFLTDAEERALTGLLRTWGKDVEADFIVLLVDTGLRMGEALRLTQRDVHDGMLHVWETKNGEPRSVPMTARVRAIVESRGLPLAVTRFGFRATWDRARAHLGLAEDGQFVPHALRHTCASRLIQRGVGLRVVQQWLGHKAIQVTMRYAHLAPRDLINAAKVLEEGV